MSVSVVIIGDQKRALEFLKLEGCMIVSHLLWLLRTLLGSSARGLDHQPIFPVPRQPPDDR